MITFIISSTITKGPWEAILDCLGSQGHVSFNPKVK